MPTAKNAIAPVVQPQVPLIKVRRNGAARPAAGPAVMAPVAAAAAAVADAAAPAAKPKRPKLVRDSFTIPKAEYAALQELKQRALGLGHHARKSELLRAGIKTLSAMTDKAFLASLAGVPAMKTGRPAKN